MADDDLDLKTPEIIPATDLEIPPEGTRTPEEEDSLLGMLARKRHPEHFEAEPPEPPAGGEEPPEPPEPPEVKAGEGKTPETPPEEPPEKKEPAPEPPEFKPKYKSQEEAERAYAEAERKMHEATTQAAQEREERERLSREAEELRQKLAEKEAAPAKPPEPPAKTPEELEAEQEGRIEAALEEIGELDEADPDYKKKVAKAWRKAGVGGAGQPAVPDPKTLDEMIDRRLEERQRQEEEDRSTWVKAVEMAQGAGLNMEEGSEDYELFRSQARVLPRELSGKPLQEQVEWAAEEAKKLRKPAAAPTSPTLTDEEKELIELGREYKAKQAQKENVVLGIGGNKLTPSKEPQQETFSMGSILKQQRQARQARSST